MTAPVKIKRMTPKQWAEARSAWAVGDTTLDALMAKYGVSRPTLVNHFAKHNVEKGSAAKQVEQAATNAATEEAAKTAALTAQRSRETKDDFYKWSSSLGKMIISEVITARKAGTPLAVISGNLKALNQAISGLQKAQDIAWKSLGLDQNNGLDEDLPELLVRELTDDEKDAIQDSQREVDGLEDLSDVAAELDEDAAAGEGEGDEEAVEGEDA